MEGQIQTSWGKKRSCEICKSVKDTSHHKRRDTDNRREFDILKGPLGTSFTSIIINLLIDLNVKEVYEAYK